MSAEPTPRPFQLDTPTINSLESNTHWRRRFRYVPVQQDNGDASGLGLGIIGLAGFDTPIAKPAVPHRKQNQAIASSKSVSSSHSPSLTPSASGWLSPSSPALTSSPVFSPTASPVLAAQSTPIVEPHHANVAAVVVATLGSISILGVVALLCLRFWRRRGHVVKSETISSFGTGQLKELDDSGGTSLTEVVIEKQEDERPAIVKEEQRPQTAATLSTITEESVVTPPDTPQRPRRFGLHSFALPTFDEPFISLPYLDRMSKTKSLIEKGPPKQALPALPTIRVEEPLPQPSVAIKPAVVPSNIVVEATPPVEKVPPPTLEVSLPPVEAISPPIERSPSFLAVVTLKEEPPKLITRVEPMPFIPEILVSSATLSSLGSAYSLNDSFWQSDLLDSYSAGGDEVKQVQASRIPVWTAPPSRIPTLNGTRSCPTSPVKSYERHRRHRRSVTMSALLFAASSTREMSSLMDEQMP